MERKRTTVYIDPYLLRLTKKTAAEQGSSIQNILNDALRNWLGVVKVPNSSPSRSDLLQSIAHIAEKANSKWDAISVVEEIREQRKEKE